MNSIEQIVQSVKELEERFLEKGEETGDPAVDGGDTGEVGTSQDRYDEVEALMSVAQNSALSCMVAIEQMFRRGHKDKIASMFGADAEGLLKQTQECLHGIAEMFSGEEKESEEKPDEDAEDLSVGSDEEESDDEDDSKDSEDEKKKKKAKKEEPKEK